MPTASRIPIHNVKKQVGGRRSEDAGQKTSSAFHDLASTRFLGMAGTPASKAPVGTDTGGADRDRTGDPLLAKQVLSQLSYGPKSLVNQRQPMGQNWWAREDLNFRPHAYQARALTS
jgi:hypothetical protein